MQEKYTHPEKFLTTTFNQIHQMGLQRWIASNAIKNLEDLLQVLECHITKKLRESIDFQNLQKETPKERLFEIIFMRLEYMVTYKKGLKTIANQGWKYPTLILHVCELQKQVAREILILGAISTEGPFGYAKEKVILGVYLLTFYKWLTDETESLEVTMAFLDQALTWCERQMERYQ